MTKSVFTQSYRVLRINLIAARKMRGLSQADVAKLLSRPQSFVSKYESGERRLDVVEFLQVASAIKADYQTILGEVLGSINE